MIKYVHGNLLDSSADVLVNPVNCVGVMGGGLALAFKNKYPDMFKAYVAMCYDKELVVGSPQAYHLGDNKYILLFPTKDHYKYPSKIEYIEDGLRHFNTMLWSDIKCLSFAFPKLGCGLGGLDWLDVEPLMVKYLTNIPNTIYIYT